MRLYIYSAILDEDESEVAVGPKIESVAGSAFEWLVAASLLTIY
jgi:hypothetical protein